MMPPIGLDKLYHFGVGLVVTFLVGAAVHPWLGLLACAVIAVAKEFYDKRHPETHTPDGWDAYATLVGAIPALPLLAWVMRG